MLVARTVTFPVILPSPKLSNWIITDQDNQVTARPLTEVLLTLLARSATSAASKGISLRTALKRLPTVSSSLMAILVLVVLMLPLRLHQLPQSHRSFNGPPLFGRARWTIDQRVVFDHRISFLVLDITWTSFPLVLLHIWLGIRQNSSKIFN